MKNQYSYRLVPEWNAVFKIKEDCCYDKVVFQGNEIGMVSTMDKENELIGILLCGICDPNLKILQLSEDEYYSILFEVNSRRKQT